MCGPRHVEAGVVEIGELVRELSEYIAIKRRLAAD
jgi:hypothetical protein